MWRKKNATVVRFGASLIDEMTLISKRGKLIVTALWDDRSSWELVKFNWEGTEINDTEVFDKLNHIQILWPAVPTLYSQFHILSWHTTLINLALWNTFWLHLASTATPVCQSIISQAPDSCPTHIIKVVEAWRSLNLRPQEAALWNTLAFFSSVWMGLLFFFFFFFSFFWVQTSQFCLEICASHQLNKVERGDSLLDHR